MPALLDELEPLLRAVCDEVHGRPLNLNRDEYLRMAAAGRYALWVAREDDGRPVGMCGMILAHHQQLGAFSASQDTLYLQPAHRQGVTGIRLLQQVDRELLELGAVIVYRTAPSGTALGRLYERAGYAETEVVFERSLT
jgi:GNAT superfamily N-acetyltransferase